MKLISYVLVMFLGVATISFCLISIAVLILCGIAFAVNLVAGFLSLWGIVLIILALSVAFSLYCLKKGLRHVIDKRF